MFFVKKIVTPFLLPPGVFVALILALGAWQLRRRRWRGGGICLVLALLMWALATVPVADFLAAGLISDLQQPSAPTGDVIIVLGGGVDAEARDLTGKGAASGRLTRRIVTAVRLQQRLNLPLLATGGRYFDMVQSEAAIIRRYLVDLGVPAASVLIEERSRDTAENARFCAQICRRQGFTQPILVTDALHIKRARLSFARAGLDVLPFPVSLPPAEGRRLHWTDFLPRSYRTAADALHEHLGLLYYRLTL